MKNVSFLFALLFCSGSLFAQTMLNTNTPANWGVTTNIGCSPAPLTPAAIAGLNFPNTPFQVCPGINSPTGNTIIGPGGCSLPNQVAHVFRISDTLNTQPCLATYNFSADNTFRIYVNGNSSPTNILGGTDGVCGNQYSGNDWRVAFPGTLNINDFNIGANNIDFETQNGISPNPNSPTHPFWLSGSLLLWQYSDLNPYFINNFIYNPNNNTITLNYNLDPSNGAQYRLLVEFTNSYPNAPVWNQFFTLSSSNKKTFKLNQCPPVPINCDANGAAIRITLTAMAGSCQISSSYLWSCNQGNGLEGGVQEQTSHYYSNTDEENFVLTPDQIKDIHDQYNEKLMNEIALNTSIDSLFEASEAQFELKVFPNPSNGHIWVKTMANENDLTPIKIFNQIGKIVYEGRIQNRQELDLNELPNGIYYLKTFGEKASDLNSTQFILQR